MVSGDADFVLRDFDFHFVSVNVILGKLVSPDNCHQRRVKRHLNSTLKNIFNK